MKTLFTCLTLATMLLAVPLVAQDASSEPAAVPAPGSGVSGFAQSAPRPPGGLFTVYGNQQRNEMNKAIDALGEAESDEDRAAARKTIRELLEKEYDAALDDYETYLDELNEKIQELREQVSRRRAAKAEMVDLRLQMMISEAEGLGWPDSRGSLRHLLPGRGATWSGPRGLGLTVPAAPASPMAPRATSTKDTVR